ncbi:hypothetical protein FA95DRAFT_1001615 [Auriscalpium vulgare]|uniref:Uncharacterized protein n=1 Tax=Auriscalpium vulgare TaxID=40419 RepID=A0ACB8R6F5_9AGAM|nr:hypothetical protein FA95DRAFT_1001615 [Auriscalpium vulgare]
MVVDDLFSGKGAQKGIRWYHEGGSRKQVAETTDSDSEARGTGYDEDEEMSARFTAERSSARETGKERNNLNSSTSSKPLTDDGHISEDDIKHRLADFVIIRRRGQTRAVVSVVEVKPQPWTKDSLFNKGAERLAARTRVSEMMPQVVQQVQFAFREHSSLQRVWALCLVGHWCRFLCFDREKTPGIVFDDIHPRGYKPDPAKNEPEADEVPSSESAVFPILTEDGHDFHPDFKTHWLEFMKWARSMELQD